MKYKYLIQFQILLYLIFQFLLGPTIVYSKDKTKNWLELGLKHKKSGNNKKALKAFNSAIKADPKNSDAYFQLGFTFQSMNLYLKALDSYKEGVRLNPNYDHIAEAFFNMSVAADGLKKGKMAVKYQKKSLQAYTDRGDISSVYRAGMYLQYLSKKYQVKD